ncbi:MAG TPA: class I SAM-dependent methyltransferase [Candidatus Acidoferrales bacterium]|nr:class I SAM-dependent methyltransferase [Candidatus Acidoferrales bacterium]
MFVNPQPSDAELATLYASHDQGDQWRVHEDRFNRAIRREIRGFRASGSLLDVGCGSGNFLEVMRDGGFSVTGIERSETGWRYAVETHGLDVFHGSIEDFLQTRAERTFDVVTLLNVFEHLKHPRMTLLSLAGILNPRALIAVVVPDTRLHRILASVRRLAGSNDPFWMNAKFQPIVAIDPPFHLTCFEPRTLRLLIESCGYQVLKIANAPVISNPQLWKRMSKLAVATAGTFLELLSLGRVVVGYSTIAIAQKQ